jgi:hypothetical protein
MLSTEELQRNHQLISQIYSHCRPEKAPVRFARAVCSPLRESRPARSRELSSFPRGDEAGSLHLVSLGEQVLALTGRYGLFDPPAQRFIGHWRLQRQLEALPVPLPPDRRFSDQGIVA